MYAPGRSRCRDLRASRPQIEGLEERKLLYATLGDMWTYPSRITYSFAPDGTNIGGYANNMNATMASIGYSTAQWQAQFQKAFAIWEAVANINLVQVPDNGAAFGAAGNQQGDPNFGDIRVGGENLWSNTLALTFLPPPDNGDSLAGDIVFNTSQKWQINSTYDVLTVAIHEVGHALGMDHSAITQADMYAYYNTTKQTLNSDDSAGIQTIYGARQPDTFDAAASNQTASTATDITSYLNAQGQISLSGLDIMYAMDTDYYTVTAPANTTGTMTVTMQSSNLSSLDPKVVVYNGPTQGLGQAMATNSYGATVSYTVTNVVPGQKFYIKCQAALSGPTGSGAYGLQINFGSGTMAPVAPPVTVVASQPNQKSGGGSSGDSLRNGKGNGSGEPSQDQADFFRLGDVSGYGDALTVAPRFARKVARLQNLANHRTKAGHLRALAVMNRSMVKSHGRNHA